MESFPVPLPKPLDMPLKLMLTIKHENVPIQVEAHGEWKHEAQKYLNYINILFNKSIVIYI